MSGSPVPAPTRRGGRLTLRAAQVTLHIIERDPCKDDASETAGRPLAGAAWRGLPEKFIRRSHHMALTVSVRVCACMRTHTCTLR